MTIDPKSAKHLPVLTWTPELSHRFWNRLAGTEFQQRIAFSRFAAPYLIELVKRYFPANAKVLDYGSGYSLYLVEELMRQGFRAAFYEPSVPSDEHRSDLARNQLFLGAVTDMTGKRFDVAFLSEVIEHLYDDDIPVIFNRLHSCLREDGVLVVTTPCNENLLDASRFCPTCEQLFHPWGHVRSFSLDQVEKLLERYGFRCEALLNVDFSAARDAVEELTRLKDRIARLLVDLEEACPAATAERAEVPALAERISSSLQDLKGAFDFRDPARCQIGFGGTIVAVAKKAAG
jgi:SAM-dependent methyltransferase